MKKLTISTMATLAFLMLNLSNSSAQKFAFGISTGGVSPMGAFAAAPTITQNQITGNITNFVNTGTGGFSFGLHARYFINDNMAAGLNFGYSFVGAQDMNKIGSGVIGVMTIRPIMAAFDYYFLTDKFRPYAGLEFGVITTSLTITDGLASLTGSGTGIAVAPVLGVQMDFTDHFGIMANVKYMYGMNEHKWDSTKPDDAGIAATSYIGYNLGVNFTFGDL